MRRMWPVEAENVAQVLYLRRMRQRDGERSSLPHYRFATEGGRHSVLMSRQVEVEWEPEAEWEFTAIYKPEMQILRLRELYAPNEALATLFGFRWLRDEGYEPEQLSKIKVERIN